MNIRSYLSVTIATALAILLPGCTVHPQGEREERRASIESGRPFSDRRTLPPLPVKPSDDDLVHYALLTNANLEHMYWEWRSAIEQIPQDGTQSTNLALSASLNIARGSTNFSQGTIGAGNDPMADIVLPPKLSAAARRALENARAAGWRFRKAKFDLQKTVLDAYLDYALTAELIRLQQSITQSLETAAGTIEARVGAGGGAQQDLLKAKNEVDLSRNDIAAMKAQLAAERAALNALLNRAPAAFLPVPEHLPDERKMQLDDMQLLTLAASRNPELAAIAREIAGRKDAIDLAKLQYLPDISISASGDLQGIGQNLIGMITVPWLRHEAIDAAIAQAEANLKSAQTIRRQERNDIFARAILDITTARDADRQLDLFEHSIIPRIAQSNAVARSAYEASNLTLSEVLEGERSLLAIQRLTANLRVLRAKSLGDLEAICAEGL